MLNLQGKGLLGLADSGLGQHLRYLYAASWPSGAFFEERSGGGPRAPEVLKTWTSEHFMYPQGLGFKVCPIPIIRVEEGI